MIRDDVHSFFRALLDARERGGQPQRRERPRRAGGGAAWPGTSYLETCDLCGRRILVGERSLIAEDGDGHPRLLCSLCGKAIAGEAAP